MRPRYKFSLVVLLTLFLSLTACSQPAGAPSAPNATSTASVPDGPAASSASHLGQALAFLPADANQVFFTDWSLIKKYKGVSDLNSQSSLEQRRTFVLSLIKDQAAASGYGLSHFETQAQAWGWDSTDLVWEASTEVSTTVYVLKFRDDYDFVPMLTLFDQRGYAKSDHLGKTIYSHALDPAADWLKSTDLAILNAAVIPDDNVLILSLSGEAVSAVLDVRTGQTTSLVDDHSIQSVIKQLGGAATAYLSRGAAACTAYSAAAMLTGNQSINAQAANIQELLNKTSQFHVYAALGVGYQYEGDQPVGQIVMDYQMAGDAQSDLEPRRLLADQGTSLAVQRPYSLTSFSLIQATVDGSDLVLRVTPFSNQPKRLFDMVYRRDMLFAVCP